jgi:serine/threonine protein kinase
MPSLTRKKRPSRTRRRVRSANTNQRSASENIIGEGAFGSVSRPPAKCGPQTPRDLMKLYYDDFRNNKNYVSKLTEQIKAEQEYEIGQRVSELPDYQDYFIVVEFICPVPDSKVVIQGIEELDTYAMMKYGGSSMEDILRGKSPYVFHSKKWIQLIHHMKSLVRGIQLLHEAHIYHQDIHLGNIVYTPQSGARLIDFGQAEHITIQRLYSQYRYADLDMLINGCIVRLLTYLEESRMFSSRHTRGFHHSMTRFLRYVRENPIRNEGEYDRNIQIFHQQLRRFFDIITE